MIVAGLNTPGDYAAEPLVSAFAYLHDRAIVAEMGLAAGIPASDNATRGITAADALNFNQAFRSPDGKSYAAGKQTELVMALALPGVVPDGPGRRAVLQTLADDIVLR